MSTLNINWLAKQPIYSLSHELNLNEPHLLFLFYFIISFIIFIRTPIRYDPQYTLTSLIDILFV